MKLQYWHRVWNGAAIRRYGEQNAGDTGWASDDDWFNGEWKTADTRARSQGRTIKFSFAHSNEREFPELKVLGVPYRPTLKFRVAFAGAHPNVASLRALTDSIWQNPEAVRIQFEDRSQCDDPVQVYNGSVLKDSARTALENGTCTLYATVTSARNSDDPEADRTIVTVQSPTNPFSFAMDEIVRGDRIFVKDFGVLVTRASDPVTIAEHRRALEEIGEKAVYDRIKDHPEQTLPGAWGDSRTTASLDSKAGGSGSNWTLRATSGQIIPTWRKNIPERTTATSSGPMAFSISSDWALPDSRIASWRKDICPL
jgi:hypothetical protein